MTPVASFHQDANEFSRGAAGTEVCPAEDGASRASKLCQFNMEIQGMKLGSPQPTQGPEMPSAVIPALLEISDRLLQKGLSYAVGA